MYRVYLYIHYFELIIAAFLDSAMEWHNKIRSREGNKELQRIWRRYSGSNRITCNGKELLIQYNALLKRPGDDLWMPYIIIFHQG